MFNYTKLLYRLIINFGKALQNSAKEVIEIVDIFCYSKYRTNVLICKGLLKVFHRVNVHATLTMLFLIEGRRE